MAMLIPDHFQTIIPTEADVHLAFESSHRLAAFEFGRRTSARIHLGHDASAEPIVLPVSALRLLSSLLTEMSKGNSVTVIPTQAELTAQQAAGLLHVSRPYVDKFLDEGKIASRLVGKYRRVRFADLLAHKQKDDEARTKVLDQLAADAKELEMGY